MISDDMISLKVATPAGVYEGEFRDSLKVREVIEIIAKEKKLVEGDTFELAYNGKPLVSRSPIGSFDFMGGAVLDLLASGSAV